MSTQTHPENNKITSSLLNPIHCNKNHSSNSASCPIATPKNSSLTLCLAKRFKKITVKCSCFVVPGRMIWNSWKKKWKAVPRPPLPPKFSPMLTIILRSFPLLTKFTNSKIHQSVPGYQIHVQSLRTTSLSKNSLVTLCPLIGHPTVQLKKPRLQSYSRVKSRFPTVNRKCTFMKWKSWSLSLTSLEDKIKNWKKSANSSKNDAKNLRTRCHKSQVQTVIAWWRMKICCKRWKANHFGSFTSKHRKW